MDSDASESREFPGIQMRQALAVSAVRHTTYFDIRCLLWSRDLFRRRHDLAEGLNCNIVVDNSPDLFECLLMTVQFLGVWENETLLLISSDQRHRGKDLRNTSGLAALGIRFPLDIDRGFPVGALGLGSALDFGAVLGFEGALAFGGCFALLGASGFARLDFAGIGIGGGMASFAFC